MVVAWEVRVVDELSEELDGLDVDVQDVIFATARLLTRFGPQLGRPHVDTLVGSRHANMKELRCRAADGE